MTAPDKKNLSPFAQAALALDADFVELERLSGQIDRIAIESDSGLERVQQLLVKFAECGQRVADGVIVFSRALQEAHARAEQAGQIVSARAALVRERQQETDRMLERFHMLSDMVAKITMLLVPFKKPAGTVMSADDRVLIKRQIPEIDGQLGTLIDEALKLRTDAQRSQMRTLERDAASLGHTLMAARSRLNEIMKDPLLN